MFRVNQRVVCVDDTQPKAPWTKGVATNDVKRGTIYTVAAVGLTHCLDPEARPCIEVIELPRSPLWAHRFRPIVERKTDISVFEEILRRESIPDECAPAPARAANAAANGGA